MKTRAFPLAILIAAGMLMAAGGAASAGYEFPICTDPGGYWNPAISGNVVVWVDQRAGSDWEGYNIYGYDLSTHAQFPICTADSNQVAPAISGDIVVWQDYRNDENGQGVADTYGYNLSTHTEFAICANGANQISPAVDGHIVVWADRRNYSINGWDIYGRDLATGQEFPICTDPGDQGEPAISGNIVVWADGRNPATTGSDIYGRDLATGQTFPICTAQRRQWAPAISGNIVVWEDHRDDTTWPDDTAYGVIYGYDLATHQEFPIMPGFNPAISGSIVVWEDIRNGSLDCGGGHCSWHNRDLYARNLSTGQEIAICTRQSEQFLPAISGNIIVWADQALGYSDIFGYILDGVVPPEPPPAPSNLTAIFISPYDITLGWKDNSSDETGFKIERKNGTGGTWEQIRILVPNTTSCSEQLSARGQTLYYRARAFRGDVNSNYSNEAPVHIPAFDDVPVTAPFWQHVEAIWRQRITQGCSSTIPPLYCPYANVSRAQMAVFLCKAAHKGPLNRETSTFCDVPKTDPSYAWIERLADSASWGGNPPTIGCTLFPCKKFCPSSPVLRDEMAAFLVRATGKSPMPSCSGVFADVWAGGWACPYIERLTDPGSWPGGVPVTSGCAQGPPRFYCPKSNVTRAQMAVFIVRAFGIPL
jgi:beta propeller repeat protein